MDCLLNLIREHLLEQPEVSITFFQPDEHKSGGRYVTINGRVKKIAGYERKLIFVDGSEIMLEDIFDIEGELPDRLQKLVIDE